MNLKKSLVYIIAAAIAVLIALFLINNLITGKNAGTSAVEAEEPLTVQTEGIIVAASDIKAGSKITDTMIKTQQYPSDSIPVDAYRYAYDIVGRSAAINITTGQILNPHMINAVEDSDEESFALKVPDGFVALSISVKDIEGVSGYLVAGDTVNILADAIAIKAAMDGEVIWPDDSNPATQAYLAKNVTVLSVGDKHYDKITMAKNSPELENASKDSRETDTANGEKYMYESVVLCLDDYTARIVVEVLKTSRLFLSLQHRSENEDIVIQRPYLPGVAQSFDSFLPKSTSAPASPTPAGYQGWAGSQYSTTPTPTPSPTPIIYPWQSIVR